MLNGKDLHNIQFYMLVKKKKTYIIKKINEDDIKV